MASSQDIERLLVSSQPTKKDNIPNYNQVADTNRAILYFVNENHEIDFSVGDIVGTAERDQNKIAVKLSTVPNPLYLSYFELRFYIRWNNEFGNYAEQIASVHLYKNNLGDENIVDYENLNTWNQEDLDWFKANLVPGPENDRFDDGVQRGVYTHLKFRYERPGAMWNQNFNSGKSFHPDLDPILARLVTAFSTPGTLKVVARISRTEPVDAVVQQITDQRTSDAIEAWYPATQRQSGRFFIQMGMYLPPADRTPFRLPPQVTFPTFLHYQAIVGYGMIQDWEHQAAVRLPRQVEARVFKVVGGGDRELLLLIRADKYVFKLTAREKLRVSFENDVVDAIEISDNNEPQQVNVARAPQLTVADDNDDDVAEDVDDGRRWRGVALPPIAYHTLLDTPISVSRPREEQSAAFLPLSDSLAGIIAQAPCIADADDADGMRRLMSQAPSTVVTVIPQISKRVLSRQINAMRVVNDHRRNELAPFLLLNNIVGLHVYDAFAGLQPRTGTFDDLIATMEADCRGDPDQLQGLTQIRSLRGNVGIIVGNAGTGKSTLASTVIGAYINTTRRANQDRVKNRILVTGPVNDIVSRFARDIYDRYHPIREEQRKEQGNLKPLIVVRVHMQSTEKDIFRELAHRPVRQRGEPLRDNTTTNKPIPRSIMEMINAYRSTEDARVTQRELSVGHWMGLFLGIINKGNPFDIGNEFPELHNQWQNYTDGEEMDMGPFTTLCNQLRDRVLREADVIATTLNMCGDGSLLNANITFSCVVITEAAKAIEPDTLISLAYWFNPGVTLLCEGDPRQLRPTVLSHKTNCFAAQQKTPWMTRAMIAGCTTIKLRHQHRFPNNIADLVRIFYERGAIVNSPNRSFPLMDAAKEAMRSICDRAINANLWMIVATNGLCEKIAMDPSKYNEVTCAISVWAVEKLGLAGFPLEHVGLITPYDSQHRLHVRCLKAVQDRHPNLDFGKVWTGKFDSIQGSQIPFVVGDFVIDHQGMGFVADDNRPNSGITRADTALLLVVANSMQNSPEWAETRLAKVYQHMSSRRLYNTMDDANLDYLSDLLPSRIDKAILAANNANTQPDNPDTDGNADPSNADEATATSGPDPVQEAGTDANATWETNAIDDSTVAW